MPKTHHQFEQKNETICIISYELGSNRSAEITSGFARYFWRFGINTSIVAITKFNQQQVSFFSNRGLLLLGKNNEALEENIQALADFSLTRQLIVVHMYEQCVVCPPQINVHKVVMFERESHAMLSNLFNAIIDEK